MGTRSSRKSADQARYLEQQMSKIIDQSEHVDSEIEVLVQLDVPDEWNALFTETARVISRRSAIVSARDLVPRSFAEQQRKTGARRQPGSARGSDELFVRALSSISAFRGRSFNLGAYRAFERSASARKGQRKAVVVTKFPYSGAVLVRGHRDVLAELARSPASSLAVTEFFANRVNRLPGLSRANALPPEVVDSRSHSWGVARSGAMAVWGGMGARGRGARVAVLDTGVDAQHQDLAGKIAGFAEFDAEGKLIRTRPARDTDRHGTHVSGTIVGGNASGRWIGMAPDAELLCGVVLPNGRGTDAQIVGGIEWAIAQRADVICMSLGGLQMTADVMDVYSKQILTANQHGIPVVVAIGNEGAQTTSSPANDFFAFSIGATDVEDRAAGFSGGRTQLVETSRYIDAENLPLVYSKPEVTAPGVAIYSSVPGNKYEAWNGTSMATPHVAGAMALLLSDELCIRSKIKGHERTQLLQDLIVSTVKELGESGQNHRFGYGRLDVLRAVGYAIDLGYGAPQKRGGKRR